MNPVYLNEMSVLSALGDSHAAHRKAIYGGEPIVETSAEPITEPCAESSAESSGVQETDLWTAGRMLPMGTVSSALPDFTNWKKEFQTRCNQLLLAAMKPLMAAFEKSRSRVDPLRIAVIVGTSTSGIGEGQQAIAAHALSGSGKFPESYSYQQQEMAIPAEFLADYLQIQGPSYVISTACSSSAKALASARRLLNAGFCDLCIAGGVDALCGLTVDGFSALGLVSKTRCQPLSANRNGINIGEGAALFLMSRDPSAISLAGVGECSDAYHISAPDPSAAGACSAMRLALDDAGLQASAIDYVNLHGTATVQNDAMEARAIHEVFVDSAVVCSSSKAYTGHCLGAAGAIEAALCYLTLSDDRGLLPVHLWDGHRDPEIAPISLTQFGDRRPNMKYALSNSFAFGGNNISLLLARTNAWTNTQADTLTHTQTNTQTKQSSPEKSHV